MFRRVEKNIRAFRIWFIWEVFFIHRTISRKTKNNFCLYFLGGRVIIVVSRLRAHGKFIFCSAKNENTDILNWHDCLEIMFNVAEKEKPDMIIHKVVK